LSIVKTLDGPRVRVVSPSGLSWPTRDLRISENREI